MVEKQIMLHYRQHYNQQIQLHVVIFMAVGIGLPKNINIFTHDGRFETREKNRSWKSNHGNKFTCELEDKKTYIDECYYGCVLDIISGRISS